MKVEEENRLAQEAEQQRRRETPTLGNITLPNRKRRRDVLEQLALGYVL
jgi:hypothetical protein